MVFSSLLFIYIFLPVNLLCYAVISDIKKKNICLLIFSLLFYAWTSPKYLLVMMSMALINYLGALGVKKYKDIGKSGYVLAADIAASLCILAFFKYLGFICEISKFITGVPKIIPQVVLPVGISFYTFQLISYVVDVYRGEVEAEQKYWKVLLYAALFHQCIAGPIVRYKDIADDLKERKTGIDDMNDGISRFTVGLAKKTLLANTCASIVNSVLPESLSQISNASVLGSWFGMLLYALQIYLDFSAYSDMAIGLGKMTGFHYKENFNYPYAADSITDFWRKWHISLGTFFRDYLYIPLGGNRKGLPRQLFNILVVWMLTGIWHGAGWNFLFWGLWFAFFLILEKLFLGDILESVPKVFGRIYTLAVVLISWVFFALESPGEILAYLQAMFGMNGIGPVNSLAMFLCNEYLVLLVIALVACLPLGSRLVHALKSSKTGPAMALYRLGEKVIPAVLLLLSVAYIVDASYNPFLYFRF